MMPPETTQRTLDALSPAEWNRSLTTIALTGGKLVARSVSPTLETGQHVRELAHHVEGLETAIDTMLHPPSPERSAYLKERLAFWRAQPLHGLYGPGEE
jgi:hypothetical protein